jgi:hypothetical protein
MTKGLSIRESLFCIINSSETQKGNTMEVYSTITSLDQMVDYVVRELGYPEINVELHPDTVRQQIHNARAEYIRYAGGEGYYQDYFVVKLPAGQSEIPVDELVDRDGNKIGADIDYVYSFNTNMGMGGINTLFSPTHMILSGSMYSGTFPGVGTGGGMVLAEYEIAMGYMEDIKRTFGKSFNVRYIPGKKIIKVSPEPQSEVIGVLSAYNNLKLNELFDLVNFRNLCVAKTGVAWGKRLGKMTIALPDGSTVNGRELLTDYKEDYKDVKETIEAESEGFDIIVA